MTQVRLHAPLKINLTGFDREATDLPAGDQEASAELIEYVVRNPSVGEVLTDVVTAAPGDQEPQDGPVALEELTNAQLIEMATQLDLEIPNRPTKATLVAALYEALSAGETDSGTA